MSHYTVARLEIKNAKNIKLFTTQLKRFTPILLFIADVFTYNANVVLVCIPFD